MQSVRQDFDRQWCSLFQAGQNDNGPQVDIPRTDFVSVTLWFTFRTPSEEGMTWLIVFTKIQLQLLVSVIWKLQSSSCGLKCTYFVNPATGNCSKNTNCKISYFFEWISSKSKPWYTSHFSQNPRPQHQLLRFASYNESETTNFNEQEVKWLMECWSLNNFDKEINLNEHGVGIFWLGKDEVRKFPYMGDLRGSKPIDLNQNPMSRIQQDLHRVSDLDLHIQ